MKHELVINDLQPTYLSPFNAEKLLIEARELLGANYMEGKSKITINGTQHFEIDSSVNLILFKNLVERAIINSCLKFKSPAVQEFSEQRLCSLSSKNVCVKKTTLQYTVRYTSHEQLQQRRRKAKPDKYMKWYVHLTVINTCKDKFSIRKSSNKTINRINNIVVNMVS